MNTRTIAFRTAAQAAIFEHEIKGQLSDGHWENDPRSCWQTWCDTDVVVDPTNLGRDFYVKRDGFSLDNKLLLDVVGDRMRVYAVLARAGYQENEIQLLDHCFSLDGSWVGIPDYVIKYAEEGRAPYDDVLRNLKSYDLDLVRRQVENGLAVYDTKALRTDLREMKKIMKTRRTAAA